MAGHSRPKDGVASLAYVPAISLSLTASEALESAALRCHSGRGARCCALSPCGRGHRDAGAEFADAL